MIEQKGCDESDQGEKVVYNLHAVCLLWWSMSSAALYRLGCSLFYPCLLATTARSVNVSQARPINTLHHTLIITVCYMYMCSYSHVCYIQVYSYWGRLCT